MCFLVEESSSRVAWVDDDKGSRSYASLDGLVESTFDFLERSGPPREFVEVIGDGDTRVLGDSC